MLSHLRASDNKVGAYKVTTDGFLEIIDPYGRHASLEGSPRTTVLFPWDIKMSNNAD